MAFTIVIHWRTELTLLAILLAAPKQKKETPAAMACRAYYIPPDSLERKTLTCGLLEVKPDSHNILVPLMMIFL